MCSGSYGRTFSISTSARLCCSGLGVIPKKDGDWRVIYHLSAPYGLSINDFIDPQELSLHYSSVDDAISMCDNLGHGTLLAKIDLKNTFRQCPVLFGHKTGTNLATLGQQILFRQVPHLVCDRPLTFLTL